MKSFNRLFTHEIFAKTKVKDKMDKSETFASCIYNIELAYFFLFQY